MEDLEGVSLGYTAAIHAHTMLSCKGLQGTNTLAFNENSQITATKGFIGLATE
jgi:hypothetical protein